MDIKQKAYDIYAGKMLSFYLIINILNITIKQTFAGHSFLSLLTPGFGILYLTVLITYKRKIGTAFREILLWETLFMVLTFISMFCNSAYAAAILHRCIWIIAFCVPLSVMASKVRDLTLYIDQTEKANLIAFLCGFFSFVYTLAQYGRITYENYNMVICYALLFPFFYHFSRIHEKKVYIILAAAEFLIISIYGSRGQLLCSALFLIFYFFKKSNYKRRIWCVMSLSILAVVFFSFKQLLFDFIAPVVDKIGSRTLSLLIRGRITYDSGRMEMWMEAWKKILEKPIFGWGIAGDMTYLTSSPHNLFLELMLHYGILIGIFFSVLLIIFSIRMLLSADRNAILVIFFASCFIPLLLSGTYTQTPLFWVYAVLVMRPLVYFRNGSLIVIKHRKIQAVEEVV